MPLANRNYDELLRKGCTIVEMATGKPPFIELGSPQAAVFKVGYYKIHPEIPSELSDKAKSFILRCFEPSPDLRATAAELLEDSFLTEKKKSSRLVTSTELNRSISVPADRMISNNKTTQKNGFRAHQSQEETFGLTQTQTHPGSTRAPHLNSFQQMPNTALSFNSLVSSPTIENMENTLESTPSLSQIRRSSSGGLTSPEGEPRNGASGQDAEQDGFYMLKKDSQRRMTLSRVLTQDEIKICEDWMDNISQQIGETSLNEKHLELLLRGLKEYIADLNKQAIENTIRILKEELEFDCSALNHLQLALYLIQESINKVLRSHSIKPHWMFALDNLVRDAVQAAVTVLSPELGANLAGQEGGGAHQGSSTNLSTINSLKSNKNSVESYEANSSAKLRLDQISLLKAENLKLMNEVIESQKTIQSLLKQTLEEQRVQIQLLTNTLEQMNLMDLRSRRDTGYSSRSNMTNHSPEILLPQISISENGGAGDPALTRWLLDLDLNQQTIDRINLEEYTLDDLLNHVTKADLRRLNLRGGIELKIWKAIVERRAASRKLEEADSEAEWHQSLEYVDAIDCVKPNLDA